MFGYLEYDGDNFDKDMAEMQSIPVVEKWTNSSHMIKKENLLLLTNKGKFISNRILSSLLLID